MKAFYFQSHLQINTVNSNPLKNKSTKLFLPDCNNAMLFITNVITMIPSLSSFSFHTTLVPISYKSCCTLPRLHNKY